MPPFRSLFLRSSPVFSALRDTIHPVWSNGFVLKNLRWTFREASHQIRDIVRPSGEVLVLPGPPSSIHLAFFVTALAHAVIIRKQGYSSIVYRIK